MSKISWLLRSLTVNAIVACVTVGIALGVTNVLVNHVHWLGAYLIACPSRDRTAEPPRSAPPTKVHAATKSRTPVAMQNLQLLPTPPVRFIRSPRYFAMPKQA
jgi:hypothetical protein